MGTVLRVTDVEVPDHPDAVVHANARLVIVARTAPIAVEGPSNLDIEWGGDLGLSPDINGNILETRFPSGAHPVTTTGLGGGSSVTVRAWEADTEVVNGLEFPMTA
jgi:hypothetical protein